MKSSGNDHSLALTPNNCTPEATHQGCEREGGRS